MKTSAIFVSLVLLTFLIFGYFITKRQKDILYLEKVRAAEIVLNYFANHTIIPLLGDDTLSLNKLIKETKYVEGLLYTMVVDRKNIIRAHTDLTKIGIPLKEFENTAELTQSENIARRIYPSRPGVLVLNLSKPVTYMNRDIGSVHLGLSLDIINRAIKKESSSLVRQIFFLGLLIVMMAIGTTFFLSRRLNRPHSQLNAWPPEIIRKQVVVLFAGIKGFRIYANTRELDGVLKDLNEYLTVATNHILEYGGYIDKFVGDAVIGVFEHSPLKGDHSERAVRSAVAMQKVLQHTGQHGNQLLSRVGIGISSGVVLSGHLGIGANKEYTSIGESFKEAYLLHAMAGPGEIVLSRDVYQLIENHVSAEPLPPQEIIQRIGSWESFRLRDITGQGR